MYFTFGWPKTYFSEVQEQFIDVQHSFDCSLIGFIGISTLSLWSGDQHRVQLGYISRSDDSLNKFGKNQKLIWSPDSTSIAIVVCIVFKITIIEIEQEGIDILNFKYYKDHHSPTLQNDKKKYSIKFSSSFRPSTLGALCITSNSEYIFIFTKEGYLVKSSWTGELISQFSLDIVPFDGLNDSYSNVPSSSPLIVASVFYNPVFSIFGLVFENGSSAILKKKSKDKLRGYWLAKENSVSISLNLKHRLAAVGMKNGEVLIYKLPGPVIKSKVNQQFDSQELEKSMNSCQYVRTFSLLQFREITPDAIGPISRMSWTHDDNCLAVGWKNRGFCLWSVYGCKLTCTIPQMNDVTSNSRYLEPCKEGVLAFSWGPESYHLVLLSNGNDLGEFFQFTFLKASLASNPSLNYSERIILQTEDRLMLLNYKGKELGDIRWKHLQIPSAYLNDNWPIRHIALSRDRNQFAVAGKRGIILYNSLSKRWKMFGDRNQEQNIESLCLAWYKNVIIVANYSVFLKKHQFLFFPKQHLDNSSLLYTHQIPQNHQPQLIDCNDVHLALFTSESFFYLFRVLERNQKIELHLVHTLSMAVPSIPLSISLLPPIQINLSSNQSQFITSPNKSSLLLQYERQQQPIIQQNQRQLAYCLILYSNGRLCLSNAENAVQCELATNIEQYWFTNIYRDNELIGNTLWAYGNSGIQVWFPFSSEEILSNKNFNHNRSLNFDNEVYPVGFLNELGVIVGLSQGISYSLCSAYPNYEIHIKTHPFLHSILKHLLERGGAEKAWSLSSKFYTIPHFTHSLELLLHEFISDTDDLKKQFKQQKHQQLQQLPVPYPNNPSSKLEYVINFLKKFPQFPEVAMRCTRKIDSSFWKGLFSIIGDPFILYQKCLSNGRIEIAASYLKILQHLTGDDTSRKCAIDLLEISLDFDNIDLAGDLVRFLHTSDEDNATPSEDHQQQSQFDNSSTYKSNISKESKQFYRNLEQILSTYSAKLLKSKLLRNFLLFSRKTLCEDISSWLIAKKRATVLRTVEDLDMALNSIHVQFYINLPSESLPPFSPQSILQVFSTITPSTSSSNNNLKHSLSNSSIISVNNEDHNEIEDSNITNKIESESIIINNDTIQKLQQNDDSHLTLSQSPPTMVTKDEMIESLKSRIQQHGSASKDVLMGSDRNGSTVSGVSGGSNLQYSFRSHQFMVAPSTGSEYNDPYFLKESIESSMEDLYYLLQELTNANCYEWVLVIATVLLNPVLISKTLKKIPDIYENYCKMLSHQKSIGYNQLLKFIQESIYPLLQKSSNNKLNSDEK
ncbi:hypothetical protein DICPUDRAFT_149161 [Dictyostelium purpureum]|uniref:RIC1 C-terminal alpha solenoid region domain-containing protein n=1 Tax=Dictyostelium purpureum TaxID=5786 RepID=F0ZD01_DICPU|nr:uncharacterized protein DICPUDRAFT_149161 [Dictyostelium purpureum]EGC38182.1 hypothetical protein DICPUDRAFT_149161 [Dictyostelium purpureum]|eukprot:XP_003285309.1 hypothetical protein DICPUDRAFT_149161 [Dictyostelium purpureum]